MRRYRWLPIALATILFGIFLRGQILRKTTWYPDNAICLGNELVYVDVGISCDRTFIPGWEVVGGVGDLSYQLRIRHYNGPNRREVVATVSSERYRPQAVWGGNGRYYVPYLFNRTWRVFKIEGRRVQEIPVEELPQGLERPWNLDFFEPYTPGNLEASWKKWTQPPQS